MADNTKIEWADATLNYINGCSVLSPGCTNCYAMRLAGTRLRNHPSRAGLTRDGKAGPVWTGDVRAHDPALLQALSWKRPRRIFWNAHGDLFHENVPDEWIDRLFAVCGLTPQHTHMILTKRSARMREYLTARKAARPIMAPVGDGTLAQHPFNNELQPPPNVWLGVSVEDQQRADERVPDLLATPAAVRSISAEPLLGPVELGCIEPRAWRAPQGWPGIDMIDAAKGHGFVLDEDSEIDRIVVETAKLDWVIVGGESGPGARPMHADWARSLRDQCAEAGVAFHFKQWGDYLPAGQHMADGRLWTNGSGHNLRAVKKITGRLLDGRTHDDFPSNREN